MKKKILLILSAIIVIAGGLATWYIISQPKTITVSGILVTMDVPELTKNSDTIVMGTVKKRLPSRWDRSDPEEPVIYTDVIIEIEEYLKNPLDQREVTIQLLGGKVGNVNMEAMDEATLNLGEKVLLFLKKNKEGNFVVLGAMQGKYTIDEATGMAVNEDTARNLPIKQLKTQIEEAMGKFQ